MDKIFKLVILLILSSCSLNPNSTLWTKNKKIEYENSLSIIEIDPKKNVLTKEINSNIKIKIGNVTKKNINYNKMTNNNGATNYDGKLKKISKYNYSKIEYFNQYEPCLLYTSPSPRDS